MNRSVRKSVLLAALIALSGRWEWLPAAAGAYLPYFVGALHLQQEPMKALSWGVATALVGLLAALRRRSPPPPPSADLG